MNKMFENKANYIWFAWVVALAAMLGSLYFSEIKGWEPCVLCWYQRIAMYPMVIILFFAALKKDIEIGRYVLPVVGVGAVFSIYHYLLQWGLFEETCGINAVSCAYVPHKWFGFVTLPLLALVAFGLIAWGAWRARRA